MTLRCVAVAVTGLLLWGAAFAEEAPLLVATGVIDKVSKTSLAVQPRGAGGKFEKAIVLRVTGTSKVATLIPQMRSGKTAFTQRETDAKDLTARQTIAVTYTTVKGENVLLSAVVHPASK
jgi:hypothetical protein